eukprot:CAMPEP_0170509872 /NCGR_PEP_ID=MMETSP0208-20121228/65451_1 /TAXON_ID=197538 /ORGANISM="Strombidium inclinatum, Strain S3" /LENGTH=63 /DNA_ID=CAMNT_0010793271 /DNA_START=2001 /DNA_END=2192 /DNA_ORIENTATION=-
MNKAYKEYMDTLDLLNEEYQRQDQLGKGNPNTKGRIHELSKDIAVANKKHNSSDWGFYEWKVK